MDIYAYDELYEGLKEYNENCENNYENVVVKFPTTDSTYPHTVFAEVRNTQDRRFKTAIDRVASVGYLVNIYAKNLGDTDKMTVARECAKIVDEYLGSQNLLRESFNANDMIGDSSVYQIIMTYSGSLLENRRKFI